MSAEAPPQDGTVVELLVEGEWITAYWDEQADDMSPYGCPGFASEEDRLLILDFDDWRLTDRFVDAEGDRRREHGEIEEGKRLDAAQARREARAMAKERTERTRAHLIERFTKHTGEAPTDTSIHSLRREVSHLDRAASFADLGKIMKGFGL